jgi:hypothetical protein
MGTYRKHHKEIFCNIDTLRLWINVKPETTTNTNVETWDNCLVRYQGMGKQGRTVSANRHRRHPLGATSEHEPRLRKRHNHNES